jgi:hypothetical protein
MFPRFNGRALLAVPPPVPANLAKDAKPDGLTIASDGELARLAELAGGHPLTSNSNLPVDLVDFEERAAIVEYDGGYPREWAEGLARLSTMPRPERYTAPAWEALVNDAAVFLDRHGAEAMRLGWGVLDCFGADPDRPERGYAAAGLVALLRGEWMVARLHEDRAELVSKVTGARQTFYRAVSANGARPVWELSDAKASDDGGRVKVFLK